MFLCAHNSDGIRTCSPDTMASDYHVPRLAGCCFAYIQMMSAFVLLLNPMCLLKCNPLLLIKVVRYILSFSRTLQPNHLSLQQLENQISLLIPDVFWNKIVSPYKVLKVSQIPNSLFFVIYTNHQITGEGGRNWSSHKFFSAPCSPLKENKVNIYLSLLWALKKSSKHEFLNGGGVSQLY